MSRGPARVRLTGYLAGVRTVARLEFWLRIRAGRWKWLLAAWLILLTLVMAAIRITFTRGFTANVAEELAPFRGAAMFGMLMLLVLGLGLLVTPVLAAQSINGDRDRGTLATLQVTRLSAGQIAMGKWLASWGTAMVLLASTVPLTIWCFVEGGLSLARVLAVHVIVAVLLGVVCAVALGLSGLLARTTTSSVLAYLTVFGLGAGTAITFGLVTAATTEETVQTFRSCALLTDDRGNLVDRDGALLPPGQRPIQMDCVEQSFVNNTPRPDRTWWLLAPNPFVILADSAPAPPALPPVTVQGPGGETFEAEPGFDPLGELGNTVETLRVRPERVTDDDGSQVRVPDRAEGAEVWPLGLLVNLLLGAGGLVAATRRLRTPTYRLARGQRIA